MQRIFIASHRVEAYLLVDRLAHAGIKAHVFNEHASSIVGDVPPDVAQPQVWLERECDRERAEVMLRSIEADAQPTAPLRCAACGEESPGNFDLCWNCGCNLA
jgi:hypothetical protein